MQDFDLGKFKELDRIKNLGEGSLQELLLETNLTGYKVETAEGMFFPVIDYEFYKNIFLILPGISGNTLT